MSSLFVFGKTVSGDAFTDREKDTAKLVSNFQYGVNTFLLSPRRWGKTSLVKKAKAIAENTKLKIVYVDVHLCRSREDFCERYASAILTQTSNKMEEWIDRLLMTITTGCQAIIEAKCLPDFYGEVTPLRIKFSHHYSHLEDMFLEPQRLTILDLEKYRPMRFANLRTKQTWSICSLEELDITLHNDAIYYAKYGLPDNKKYQSLVAMSMSNDRDTSVPALMLDIQDTNSVMLSRIHDVSDWVITFDKNMGPEFYDIPCGDGEVPYLLDYIPSTELTGISSFLTCRPTSEIESILTPHFKEFGIDIANKRRFYDFLADIRSVSSSMIMQLNSSRNKVFEVLGTTLMKRLLKGKDLLQDSFIIPIDLHQDLFTSHRFHIFGKIRKHVIVHSGRKKSQNRRYQKENTYDQYQSSYFYNFVANSWNVVH